MAISKGCISIKEVLSLDEVVELFASLGPEAMDSVNQRLKLKDKKRSSLSSIKCTPHPENKRVATTATTSALSTCHSNRRSRKGQYENHDQSS
jgi:hypothetical protein